MLPFKLHVGGSVPAPGGPPPSPARPGLLQQLHTQLGLEGWRQRTRQQPPNKGASPQGPASLFMEVGRVQRFREVTLSFSKWQKYLSFPPQLSPCTLMQCVFQPRERACFSSSPSAFWPADFWMSCSLCLECPYPYKVSSSRRC